MLLHKEHPLSCKQGQGARRDAVKCSVRKRGRLREKLTLIYRYGPAVLLSRVWYPATIPRNTPSKSNTLILGHCWPGVGTKLSSALAIGVVPSWEVQLQSVVPADDRGCVLAKAWQSLLLCGWRMNRLTNSILQKQDHRASFKLIRIC